MTTYTIKTNAGNTVKLNLIGETGLISLDDLISGGSGNYVVDYANQSSNGSLWIIPYLDSGNSFGKFEVDYEKSGTNDHLLKNLRVYDQSNNLLYEFNGFNMSFNK